MLKFVHNAGAYKWFTQTEFGDARSCDQNFTGPRWSKSSRFWPDISRKLPTLIKNCMWFSSIMKFKSDVFQIWLSTIINTLNVTDKFFSSVKLDTFAKPADIACDIIFYLTLWSFSRWKLHRGNAIDGGNSTGSLTSSRIPRNTKFKVLSVTWNWTRVYCFNIRPLLNRHAKLHLFQQTWCSLLLSRLVKRKF